MVKRKPIPLVSPPVKSRKRARQIVTSFHKLTKEAEEVASSEATDKQARLRRLERELEEMGGRQAYQSASLLSVSFHNTSRWVTQQLSKMNLRPASGAAPLRVLEVGAINTRLVDVPWLDVRAIDLKSQHPRIEECDFFSLQPSGEYDVISSSMVINCVPTAERRGEMLLGYRNHLRPGGHLFLMLPLLCLTKSTRISRDSFMETLTKIGFRVREARNSPKVAFFCATNVPLEEEVPRKDDNMREKGATAPVKVGSGACLQGGATTLGRRGRSKGSTRGRNEFDVIL